MTLAIKSYGKNNYYLIYKFMKKSKNWKCIYISSSLLIYEHKKNKKKEYEDEHEYLFVIKADYFPYTVYVSPIGEQITNCPNLEKLPQGHEVLIHVQSKLEMELLKKNFKNIKKERYTQDFSI